MISHLLVRHLQLPCAHAPALASLPLNPDLDPRAAAEELGHTFLTCVLVGLSRAPALVVGPAQPGDLRTEHVGAVVLPETALGGEAALACLERRIPMIAVANRSVLNVTAGALGVGSAVIAARGYAEAAGLVMALREGLAVEALGRPLASLEMLH